MRHLTAAISVFEFLKAFPNRKIRVDRRDLPFFAEVGEPDETVKDLYPGAFKELDERFPEALGPELQTSVWFDSDHGHSHATKRSCTGLVVYVGRTPVHWFSKRQTSIQTSS
ncbi:hypothetical protein ACHAWF_018351 [Thalassiosira exigua]